MIVGLMVIVVATQILFGAKRLWLPSRVAAYVFSEKASRSMLRQARLWELRIAKLSHARLSFMTGRLATILITLPVIGNGLVLFLPLPFLNTLPAVAIMAIGIGFANRDGLLLLLGSTICVAVLVFLAATPNLIAQALQWLR